MTLIDADVTITTPDGEAEAFFAHPAGEGAWPAVLIWTDAIGLTPTFKDMARRLAAEGYSVLVPNPYYRSAKVPVFPAGSKPGDESVKGAREEYRKLMGPAAITADAKVFMAWLDSQPAVDTAAKAGTQGYCMGGALTFRAAAAAPDRIGAVASFHGGGLITDKPASPHLLVAGTDMATQYLVAIADNDDAKEPESKDILRTTFTETGHQAQVTVYTDCNHGWCVPSNAKYDPAGAEEAWAELLALYKTALV